MFISLPISEDGITQTQLFNVKYIAKITRATENESYIYRNLNSLSFIVVSLSFEELCKRLQSINNNQ